MTLQPPVILIVEDNPTARKMFRVVIEAEGFLAVEAADGAEAVATLRRVRPQLVLQDMMLQDIDGLALSRRLRAEPAGVAVPLIAMSGVAGLLDEARQLPCAFDDFLLKPVEPEHLIAILRRFLPATALPFRAAHDDEQLLDRVGRQLHRQVEANASLARRSALQAAQLSILSGIATAINRSADVEATLSDVLASCLDAGGITRGALYLGGPGAAPQLRHLAGFATDDNASVAELFGRRDLLDKTVAGGEPLAIPSVALSAAEASAFLAAGRMEMALLVPLVGAGSSLGVLLLGWDGASEQAAERFAFGRAIGAYIAQGLSLTAAFAAERAARAAAEIGSRTKDEFLAMLGHELRNPLSPILTALQLMKLRDDASSPKEREIIQRQVEHLRRLLDDLLDVSRITGGRVVLKRERIELATVVERAVEIASPLLEERRHHVDIDVPSAGLAVDADLARLAQVLANLLTNAAKYTPVGGRVSLVGRREGGEVVARVKDSGMGIAPELLPTVFELFVQGRRTAERAEGGLGLGLALVRTLVGLHGGTATAFSDGVNQGSEFVIRLPALEALPESVAAAGPAALPLALSLPQAKHPRRVLVVDDNLDAAESLAEYLRESGHEVVTSYDGPSALTQAAAFLPEVAILDIGLPVMDGYELGARLLESASVPKPWLIAITGYGQSRDRERSDKAGFRLHLVKPVDPDKLLELLDRPSDG